MKRDNWREKHVISFVCFHSEGGVVCIRDHWFIWHRFREKGKTSIHRPIPTNMELVYRNPEGYMEEVKIVELPYCRDSLEEYLQTAYSYQNRDA